MSGKFDSVYSEFTIFSNEEEEKKNTGPSSRNRIFVKARVWSGEEGALTRIFHSDGSDYETAWLKSRLHRAHDGMPLRPDVYVTI